MSNQRAGSTFPVVELSSGDGSSMKASVVSNLMTNYENTTKFVPAHLGAAGRINGQYILLESAADMDNALQVYALQQPQGGPASHQMTLLTNNLPAGCAVQEMKCVQDQNDQAVLTLLVSKDGGGHSFLFTRNFAATAENRWTEVPARDDVSVWDAGVADDGGLLWTVVTKTNAIYFIDQNRSWDVSAPENVSVLEVCLARVVTGDGMTPCAYILARNSNGRYVLYLVSQTDGRGAVELDFRSSASHDPSSISVFRNPDHGKGDRIFAGVTASNNPGLAGTLIYEIALSATRSGIPPYAYTISAAPQCLFQTAGTSKKVIWGARSSGELEAWIVCSYPNSRVAAGASWLLRSEQSNGKWSPPLPLCSVRDQFVIRNPVNDQVDIVAMCDAQDGSGIELRHIWSGDRSGKWYERLVTVEQVGITGPPRSFCTTSTYVRFCDAQGAPRPLEPMDVFANNRVSVNINGARYELSPNQPQRVQTDPMGSLALIWDDDAIDSPIYYFSPAGTVKAVRVVGSRSATDKLAAFDFSRLDLAPEAAEGYGKFSQDLNRVATKYDSSPSVSLVDRSAVVETDPATPSTKFQTAAQGGTTRTTIDPSLKGSVVEDFLNALSWPFESIWHVIYAFGSMVGSAATEVGAFLIEETGSAYKLVVDCAGTVLEVLVGTAQEIWSFASTFVKKVFQTVVSVIEYLGYLFDWTDILSVHDFIRTTIDKTLTQAVIDLTDTSSNIHAVTRQFFDSIAAKIQSTTYPQTDAEKNKEAAAGGASYMALLLDNPAMNFIWDHLRRGIDGLLGALGVPSLPALDLGDLGASLASRVEDIASKAPAWLQILAGGGDVGALGQDVWNSVAGILVEILQTGKDLAETILCFLGKLTEWLRGILTAAAELPVITWLYEHVITNGSKLTLLDLMALLVAIPATILGKLALPNFSVEGLANVAKAGSYSDLVQRCCGTSASQLLPNSAVAASTGAKRVLIEAAESEQTSSPIGGLEVAVWTLEIVSSCFAVVEAMAAAEYSLGKKKVPWAKCVAIGAGICGLACSAITLRLVINSAQLHTILSAVISCVFEVTAFLVIFAGNETLEIVLAVAGAAIGVGVAIIEGSDELVCAIGAAVCAGVAGLTATESVQDKLKNVWVKGLSILVPNVAFLGFQIPLSIAGAEEL